MSNKSQFIYDSVYTELINLLNAENVYYSVPLDTNTPYPFAVVENTQSISQGNKNAIFEKIYIDISLWSDIDSKHLLGDISLKLKNKLLKYNLLINETSEQLVQDTSTNEVLYRNMLSLVFLI